LRSVPNLLRGFVGRNYFEYLNFGNSGTIPKMTIVKTKGEYIIKKYPECKQKREQCKTKTEVKVNEISGMCKRTKIGEKYVYKCSKCEFTKVTKPAVEGHFIMKHENREAFKCSKCTYSTYNPDRFRHHTKGLRGCATNSYSCHKCKFVTSSRGSLFHHEKTHEEKKLPCMYCDKMFHFSWCQKKHMKLCKKNTQ
jgi:hypothetical protein